MDGCLFIKDFADKVFRLTGKSDIDANVSEHPVPRKKKSDAQATTSDLLLITCIQDMVPLTSIVSY